MIERIQAALTEIETTERVRILFACESGSRAWGFPSADSDWDVRAIYVRPTRWYLEVEADGRPDVIERPIEAGLDLGGWDVRKALRLFRRSNVPLFEWLGSPSIYRQDGLAETWRGLRSTYFEPSAAFHHYSSIARSKSACLDAPAPRWKDFFYLLRTLLAAHWIAVRRSMPPTEIDPMLTSLAPAPVAAATRSLIAAKLLTAEDRGGALDPLLSDYCREQLDRLADVEPLQRGVRPSAAPLDELFAGARSLADGDDAGEAGA